jgi:hypothetical protein
MRCSFLSFLFLIFSFLFPFSSPTLSSPLLKPYNSPHIESTAWTCPASPSAPFEPC